MDSELEGLPEYFLPIRRLGEGGMGVVWSVRDKRVDKVGALKVIRQRTEVTQTTITRFEREIRNFAQLMHPYIVQVYDVGQMDTGEPYIFMEQVNGKPIHAKLLKDRSYEEIMMLIDRILEGLDEAHAHGLIHRDLKPDNILVTGDGEGHLIPKLMDFGLALRADENDMRITSDGMVVGTPIYMAPEQACDEHYQICPATDFYGIGCILYELFCGEPPFKGSSAVMVMIAQAKEKPRPFKPLPEFARMKVLTPIIMRLLEKMPDRRYETAADIRQELRQMRIIKDGQLFGIQTLTQTHQNAFDYRRDEEMPFFSSDLAPKTYNAILPDLEHCNYSYSVLSLRPPVFVGRSGAKHILERYLKDVYQGQRPAVTLITGRPGVGKSRFIESFTQDCFKQGTAGSLVVDGSVCSNLKFALYRALFAKLLLKTLTPQQVLLGLCRFFQTDNEKDTNVHSLNAIFRAEMEERQPSADRMNAAFKPVFLMLTSTRPLVLSFDNVRPEQCNDLRAIIREITGMHTKLPVLICVVNSTMTGMPTEIELAIGNEDSIWLRHGIAIDPMSNHDMHLLVTQSLGISEGLSGFIENMSSGLPQIAVNLARQWQLAGYLEPTPHGYKSQKPIQSLPIPRIVHEAILRQINMTFSAYPRQAWSPVAAIAALFGESFTPKLLSGALKALNSDHCISHSTFISLGLSGGVLKTLNETTLSFENQLMREALLASLESFEVQDYHLAIAKTLQDNQDYAKEAASHLNKALQHYEAFKAYARLARQSAQCGNLDLATEYVEHAQESLKQHFGVIDSHTPEMRDIWFIEAEIALDREDAETASQRLRWIEFADNFLNSPEHQAYFYVLKSRLKILEGKDASSDRMLEMASACLDLLPKPLTHEQLIIKFAILSVQMQFDPEISQSFIETAKELNDMIYVGKAFLAIARRCIASGEAGRAIRILNMAIDTAHKNGDTRTEAEALRLMSKIQTGSSDVRLKTLYDALNGFEKLSDFKELAAVHTEISHILEGISPEDAKIHAQWSVLVGGTPAQTDN